MPDRRIAVFVEGAVDRAVLHELRDAGLVGEALDLPKRDAALTGKDQALADLARALSARLRAIALVDYDAHPTIEAFGTYVEQRVNEELRKVGHAEPCRVQVAADGPVPVAIAGTIRGFVIPVGAPVVLEGYTAASRAMDDYLVSLAFEKDAYDALREGNRELVDHTHVMKKLGEVLALLADNGIPVRDSKRLCLLLRGLADFHSSQAVFAERLMRRIHRVDPARLEERFSTLIGALKAADSAFRLAPSA